MRFIRHTTIALGLLALPMSVANASDLRLLSSWDTSYTAVPLMAEAYMNNVKKASDGATKITMQGPEVVPPFEQLQPLQAGVYDLLFTHGGYHQGETGIGSALDAIDGDPQKRREAGIWDRVDKHYQTKFNFKLISIPSALTGFQLLLRQPMKDGRLEGLKIRGTQVYHGLINELGGVPVNLPAGDLYTAAERGVIDGIAWPAVGAVGMKLCEVAPYMVRPSYGVVSYLILMNLNSFNKLDKAEQTLLLDQGRELELQTAESFANILKEEDAQMVACGAKFDEQSAEWGEKAQAAFRSQAWAMAIQASGAEAEEFRKFAADKGVTD